MLEIYNILSRDPRISPFVSNSTCDHKALFAYYSDLFFQFWGFEIDLLSPMGTADLLFETKPNTASWLQLHHNFKTHGRGSVFHSWLNLDHLDNLHSNHSSLRNIWLEHDIRKSSQSARSSLFDRRFKPSIFFGPLLSGSCSSSSSDFAICNYHSSCLFGVNLPHSVNVILLNSHESGLRVMQIGYMLSRACPTLRIVLKSDCPLKTNKFLCSMQEFNLSPLPTDALDLIAHTPAHAIGLECSLSGDVSSKYGLEIYARWQDTTLWPSLINKMQDLPFDTELPPSALNELVSINYSISKSVSIPDRSVSGRCMQFISLRTYVGLHHFKISVLEGGFMSSPKVYIGVVSPQFVSAGGSLVLAEGIST